MEAVKGCKKGTRLEDCSKDLGYVANDVVTETELTKIRLVRAFVETQDPSSKVLLLPNLFIHKLKLTKNTKPSCPTEK